MIFDIFLMGSSFLAFVFGLKSYPLPGFSDSCAELVDYEVHIPSLHASF